MSIDVIEYRNGNEPEIRKLTGRHRYPNAVLRRGVIGSLGLFQWIDEVSRSGAAAGCNVGITLLDEKLAVAVVRWNLTGAWPVKSTARTCMPVQATSPSRSWSSPTKA